MTIEDGYIRVYHTPLLHDPMWDWPEYKAVQEWLNTPIEDRTVSRPKDQDRDNPATPPSSQARTLGWTGYQLTVKELRSWLDQIPNHATLQIKFHGNLHGEPIITATWEIPS